MSDVALMLSSLVANAGLWIALAMSLLLFTLLAGDNPWARLAQHLLVGAGLGYAAVIAVQQVLRPRLFTPLSSDGAPWLWLPLVLVVLLFLAGFDRIVRGAATGDRLAALLHAVGGAITALMLSVALATLLVGALQATLLRQFWRAASTGWNWGAPGAEFVNGLLALVLTIAALLAITVDRTRHLQDQPAALRWFAQGWLWIGERALWFAAGVLFVRLFASRLTLLVAQVESLLRTMHTIGFW